MSHSRSMCRLASPTGPRFFHPPPPFPATLSLPLTLAFHVTYFHAHHRRGVTVLECRDCVASLEMTGCMRVHPCIDLSCVLLQVDAPWIWLCVGILSLLRGFAVVALALVSLCQHCFLQLSSARLFALLVHRCCWAYRPSPCNAEKATKVPATPRSDTNLKIPLQNSCTSHVAWLVLPAVVPDSLHPFFVACA